MWTGIYLYLYSNIYVDQGHLLKFDARTRRCPEEPLRFQVPECVIMHGCLVGFHPFPYLSGHCMPLYVGSQPPNLPSSSSNPDIQADVLHGNGRSAADHEDMAWGWKPSKRRRLRGLHQKHEELNQCRYWNCRFL